MLKLLFAGRIMAKFFLLMILEVLEMEMGFYFGLLAKRYRERSPKYREKSPRRHRRRRERSYERRDIFRSDSSSEDRSKDYFTLKIQASAAKAEKDKTKTNTVESNLRENVMEEIIRGRGETIGTGGRGETQGIGGMGKGRGRREKVLSRRSWRRRSWKRI